MKNVLKSIVFLGILFIIIEALTFALLPNCNVKKYGLYKSSAYDILHEQENTIDVLFIGDSLIYSSINPMQIWNDYGFTVYDAAEPAQIIKKTYDNLKIAIDSQHPKIVLMEANVLFRDAKKKAWYKKAINELQNLVPIYKYHNNWKKLLSPNDDTSWINVNKGYKYIKKVDGSKNVDYMKYSDKTRKFPKENIDYLKKILNLCEDNNIKFILISNPSQISYNYPRMSSVKRLSSEMNFDYIDLNYGNPANIDWTNETKDKGGHLNYLGAEKVSKYIGEYLYNLNILEDHRNDSNYKSWNIAYQKYVLENS